MNIEDFRWLCNLSGQLISIDPDVISQPPWQRSNLLKQLELAEHNKIKITEKSRQLRKVQFVKDTPHCSKNQSESIVNRNPIKPVSKKNIVLY